MERKSAKRNEQRILIASGDGDARKLAAALGERGYTVLSMPGATDFVGAIRDNRPDLIIIDFNLPQAAGCDACSLLKADSELKGIPVIFIKPLNGSFDKTRIFEAGGADYISRPFELTEVEARVGAQLGLRLITLDLERSRAQLRDAERLRDNFVHMLAHDLRNSLTAISGYLELIGLTGRETLPEKGLQYVKKGTESVTTLVGILNTMLDVSRMESGALKLNLANFDLVPMIRKVLSDVEPQRTRTELVTAGSGTRAEVTGDQDILRRVARHLVTNSLRSAGKNGPVKVRIEDRPDSVRVSMQDNGPVIPADRLSKLFAAFGEAEGNSAGKTYSQGLGFTFCRLAVEAHGGSIGAESSPEGGNIFWFELAKKP